jgi:hypothetical protein
MQYKFAFMPDDNVPEEHLKWHIEYKRREGIEKIVKMISEHYKWKVTPPEFGGKEIHEIGFVCCSVEKFNHGMQRLSAAMALFPELKHIAKSIIEEMYYPESENE